MAWESDPTPGENGTKLVRRRGEAFVADGTERRFGGIEEIEVTELERRLDGDGEGLFLLDVREPYEWEIANLGDLGATLIPMNDLDERIEELPRDREIVVHCRSGARSAMVVKRLREKGFERVFNLRGGLLAWAEEVDPSLETY